MWPAASTTFFLLTALVAALIASKLQDIPEEDGVLVLSDVTLPLVLEKYQFLLVKFFVPECQHCRLLAPQYSLAAEHLRGQEPASDATLVRLAKLDLTLYTQEGVKQGIESVPLLRLFSGGKPLADYRGDRTAEGIVRWLKRKIAPAVVQLVDRTDLELLKRDNDIVVLGYFRDSDSAAARAFATTAESLDLDIATARFALASSEEQFVELGGGGKDRGLVLFRRRDGKRVRYSATADYSVSVLSSVVSQLARSLVIRMDAQKALDVMLGKVKTLLLLFIGTRSLTYDGALRAAENLAGGYDGQITFAVVDTDTDFGLQFAEHFLITKAQLPAYRLTVVSAKEVKIYKPDTEEMSDELMGSFLSRYEAGQLEPLRQSQMRPPDWDSRTVKVLVGTNYDEVTRGSGKKVAVMLYAPKSRRCKELAPVWEQLSELYKDVNDLIFAKFNVKANEVKDLEVSTYPAIKLYLPERYKEIDHVGETTLDALRQFIDLNAVPGSELTTKEPPSAGAEDTESHYDRAAQHGEL